MIAVALFLRTETELQRGKQFSFVLSFSGSLDRWMSELRTEPVVQVTHLSMSLSVCRIDQRPVNVPRQGEIEKLDEAMRLSVNSTSNPGKEASRVNLF